MTLPTPDAFIADDGAHGARYAYKPSLIGAAFEFRLGDDALEWQTGSRTGRVPYGLIRRVRLSFRPATMQTYRFLMEIWSPNAPKLVIASTSWKGLVDQERHDADYSAFVREFHRRIGRSGAATVFDSGSAAFLYWPGLAVFVATAVVLVVLALHALLTAVWAAAGIVSFFLAMFLWQAGNFFLRNRPRTYQPLAIPQQVLPRP